MQSTSNVGNAEHAGSQSTPLERLRPFQIATLLLPTEYVLPVTIMDATNAQFQNFVRIHNLSIEMDGEWSFDDRVRLINFYRKQGRDLFVLPNKNNSGLEQNQLANNSETELIGELFEGHEAARQELLAIVGDPTPTELRDDIDMLIAEMEKSSSGEQKEFGIEPFEKPMKDYWNG